MTEGQEPDAEDSESNSKCTSDISVSKSGRDGEENESGGDAEVEDVAEEEYKVNGDKGQGSALFQQFTRNSVESQPGSLEELTHIQPKTQ